MTYLIDTNVFLEILLEQENYEAALSFIRGNKELYMSDFSLHSIGVILLRLEKPDVFLDFLEDMVTSGYIGIRRLFPEDLPDLIDAVRKYNLDFDDAYQYTTAKKYALKLVSFDSDFDRVDIERIRPF